MLERKLVSRANVNRDNYAGLPRHSLVVCAVLVSNSANLGGLCRTVEAFRLELLVLADLVLVQEPAFRGMAVSSHLWQPLAACTPKDLIPWLRQQRNRGYQLIALDFHLKAVPLADFNFPAQSVLVLGQELTGLPHEILAECDWILSIPQFGLVESLNVHTAAAIAIYGYVRQHALPE